MLIQKLRLKRGWSQQQLADASGLSVRTIQRIEGGQPASVETLKSLAAVFEVDFSTLEPEKQTMMSADSGHADHPDYPASERQEAEAFQYVRGLRRLYVDTFRFVLVTALLAVVNYLTSPHYWWVLWVLGGWGLGLVTQALRLFGPDLMLGAYWERRQIEKRIGRPL